MPYTCNQEVSQKRITAYTDFLMAAYGVDANGLADMLGIERETLAEYIEDCENGNYGHINCAVLETLGNLTGIRFSWLCAEQPNERDKKRFE